MADTVVAGDGQPALADPPKLNKKAQEDVVSEAVKRRAYALDLDDQNRKRAVEDIKFVYEDDGQWHQDDITSRKDNGRPYLQINQIPQFVNQVVNAQRQQRPSIKVRAESEDGEERALRIQGMTRHIEADSAAPAAYDEGFKYSVVCGRGYWRVVSEYVDGESFDQKLVVKSIGDVNTVLMDPDYQAPDASDINFAFVDEYMTREDFEYYHPEAKKIDWEPTGTDRDQWFDGEKRILVCDYFRRVKKKRTLAMLSDGTVAWKDELPDAKVLKQAGQRIQRTREADQITVEWFKLAGGQQVLKQYVWAGKYIPLVMCVGNVTWIGGKRVYSGLVRPAKDTQRAYNYSQTMIAERIALAPMAPFVAAAGQTENHPEWQTANKRPHSVLVYDPDVGGVIHPPPVRQQSIQADMAIIEYGNTCQQNLRAVMGLYDPSVGNNQEDQSGRAILALQQQGDVATFHYRDNYSRAVELTGKIIVDALPKYYDSQRQATMMGDDGDVSSITINKPDPVTGELENDVVEGSHSVTVDAGPSYQTKRLEAVSSMMEFLKVMPQAAPLIGDLIANSMDWPGAEKIAKRLKAMLPPQVQQSEADEDKGKPLPPEAQAQIDQLQMQLSQAGQQMQQMQQEFQTHQAEIDAKLKETQATTQAKVDQTLVTTAGELIEKLMEMRIQMAMQSVDPVTGMPTIPMNVEQWSVDQLNAVIEQLRQNMLAARGPDPQTEAFQALGDKAVQVLHQAGQPRALAVHTDQHGMPMGGTATPIQAPPLAMRGPRDPKQIMDVLDKIHAVTLKPKHVMAAHDPHTGDIVGGVAHHGTG